MFCLTLFLFEQVNKAASEDGLGTGTTQSVTSSTFSAKLEDTSVVTETGSVEQSNKDTKSKDASVDSVSTLSIPVPGIAKKKSRFIVKTVAKEVLHKPACVHCPMKYLTVRSFHI